jgi:hypothetical protein
MAAHLEAPLHGEWVCVRVRGLFGVVRVTDEKKDERPSYVPLGTFRSSVAPPPPPPAALRPGSGRPAPKTPPPPPPRPGADRDDETVRTVAIRSSVVVSPPSGSDAERKRVRTLVGVPTPPAAAFEQVRRGTYPSPPKWQSRSARQDDATEVDVPAVPVARIELKQQPSGPRSPIEVPGPGVGAPIAETIQQMLDEQAAVSMEVDEEISVVPDEPAPRKSSVPPVMLPGHVAVAAAREAEQVAEQIARRSSQPPAMPPAPPMYDLFDAPMASRQSSLAPAELKRGQRRDEATPLLGFAMVAAISLVIVGGWFLTAGGYQRKHGLASAPKVTPPSAAAVAPVAPAAPAVAPTVEPTPAAVAAPAPEPETREVLTPVESAAPALAPARDRKPVLRSAAPVAALAPKSTLVISPVTQPASAPASTGNVLRITAAPAEPKADATPVPTDLPETPSREEVQQRLQALRSELSACAGGRSGVADLEITVLASGAITNVLVSGDYAGTAEGSCIARTVRTARFSPFKQARFRLLYPYKL